MSQKLENVKKGGGAHSGLWKVTLKSQIWKTWKWGLKVMVKPFVIVMGLFQKALLRIYFNMTPPIDYFVFFFWFKVTWKRPKPQREKNFRNFLKVTILPFLFSKHIHRKCQKGVFRGTGWLDGTKLTGYGPKCHILAIFGWSGYKSKNILICLHPPSSCSDFTICT